MLSKNILEIYKKLQKSSSTSYTAKSKFSKKDINKKRLDSICVEDAFFGDSGKGSVTMKFLSMYIKKNQVICLRYNGGANAGHETYLNNQKIVTHQIPSGIIQENTLAIITRGTVFHPQDFIIELDRIAKTIGKIPGKLLIDWRTPLSLDTHRAREAILNRHTTGGRGSTGKGIASAYESLYGRYAVTVKDLLDDNWKDVLKSHYRLYRKFIDGFDGDLANEKVTRLDQQSTQKVGNERIFIKNLEIARERIKKYSTDNLYSILHKSWKNEKIPFVIEGAQGAGIDPYHGVYPDITASRPMSRNINDATYNIILPEELEYRIGVMKTTYMSSVGTRILPSKKDSKHSDWIQKQFDEKGRTTGRLRDIYHLSLPIAQYLQRGAGYTHIAATHLDASKKSQKIRVVSHYVNKRNKKETPYVPYQDGIDKLEPRYLEFDGWDGEQIKTVNSYNKLPNQTKKYLEFLSQTIAPVFMATYGADIEDYVLS